MKTIDGRALIVGAATADGGELIAIATKSNIVIDPAGLRLPAPVGAQYQHNGATRLVVAVTGTADVTRAIARPDVQSWLATLQG